MMLFLRIIIALALGNGESFIPMEVQKDSRLKLLFIVILMFTYLCNYVIFVLKYSYQMNGENLNNLLSKYVACIGSYIV